MSDELDRSLGDDPLYLHADHGEDPLEGAELALLTLGCTVGLVVAVVALVARGWE